MNIGVDYHLSFQAIAFRAVRIRTSVGVHNERHPRRYRS
jgi:hypothetical protein